MSMAEDLGKLIMTMNPYTDGSEESMEPHTFLRARHTGGGRDATCIWMEMDSYGPGEWTFKGHAHHINRALRIAYRWKKTKKTKGEEADEGDEAVWITDYLLIGFEGSNGG